MERLSYFTLTVQRHLLPTWWFTKLLQDLFQMTQNKRRMTHDKFKSESLVKTENVHVLYYLPAYKIKCFSERDNSQGINSNIIIMTWVQNRCEMELIH